MDEASKNYFASIIMNCNFWYSKDNNTYVMHLPGELYNYEMISSTDNNWKVYRCDSIDNSKKKLLYEGGKEDCALKASEDYLFNKK